MAKGTPMKPPSDKKPAGMDKKAAGSNQGAKSGVKGGGGGKGDCYK